IDVRDYQQLLDLQEKITADLGDVTILVNNAGILTLSSVENPPAHEVQRMINVNLTAPIYTTQIFLPKMKQLNRGYIVNISSILSMYPHYFFNVYGATKAALRYITSCLRIDLLESGSDVRAITICPSFLTTNKRIHELLKVFRLHRLLCDIDGSIVAQYIIEAMLRGEEELTVPRVFILCYRLLA
ncbi:NADP-dependent 3-hydroxy acid dehydrogenase YdfG-like, partial [Musca vetustissima]|uniref:NADP-dependent 3-hydroxy acid dehydrogenase YdfG-like n=1 Tax=Musca vetustissima TaxID=27455 RepID=UPI002AB65C2C